ncbi:MAG: peptidoglycan-binding protein [Aureispira sp.]|nr:peptidoglycan-binding protein [Aureispira sp.]
MIGVDHTFNKRLGIRGSNPNDAVGYNSDKTTDHFIVIIGKGIEADGTSYFMYLNSESSRNGKNYKVDGAWGNGSKKAAKAFQKDYNLDQTGQPDKATRTKLVDVYKQRKAS